MIETRGLARRYGRTEAVRDLDLSIAAGEIYGFLGPNGAGKTTTLRMLSGLLRPTAGDMQLDGRRWGGDDRALRRLIGFVPDTPPLHDFLTGRQHVELVAALFGTPREQRDERADTLLHRLDLADRAHELCKGYSQGMRKKIHLAAVLVTAPRILLLDEPTTGLDPRSVRVLKDLLLDQRDQGTTVLLSTHVLEVAEELSGRIGVIAGGQLRAEGTITELRSARGVADQPLEQLFLDLLEEAERPDAPAAPR